MAKVYLEPMLTHIGISKYDNVLYIVKDCIPFSDYINIQTAMTYEYVTWKEVAEFQEIDFLRFGCPHCGRQVIRIWIEHNYECPETGLYGYRADISPEDAEIVLGFQSHSLECDGCGERYYLGKSYRDRIEGCEGILEGLLEELERQSA